MKWRPWTMSSTSVKGDALGWVMISSSKPPNPSSPCFILPQQNIVMNAFQILSSRNRQN